MLLLAGCSWPGTSRDPPLRPEPQVARVSPARSLRPVVVAVRPTPVYFGNALWMCRSIRLDTCTLSGFEDSYALSLADRGLGDGLLLAPYRYADVGGFRLHGFRFNR